LLYSSFLLFAHLFFCLLFQALASLIELLREAQDLPVTLKEEAMLRAEVEARQWAIRVRKALAAPAKAAALPDALPWAASPLDEVSAAREKEALAALVAAAKQRTPLKTLRALLSDGGELAIRADRTRRWNQAELEKTLSGAVKVSCLLCTVTFHANHAHNLTRSP
jgi:hypothetical protein